MTTVLRAPKAAPSAARPRQCESQWASAQTGAAGAVDGEIAQLGRDEQARRAARRAGPRASSRGRRLPPAARASAARAAAGSTAATSASVASAASGAGGGAAPRYELVAAGVDARLVAGGVDRVDG